MDVRIGVTYSASVLEVDLGEADPADVRSQVEAAISGGTVLWLTDKKGRTVGVPAEKVAFIEIGGPDAERRVGFGLR